ncbi:hypothetical protein QM007_05255 [Rothia sp. SD9660Na]|uniref:hypothetical protein n=1 Tax=Rothia sp. SD9660Na TaxID=3047030 RepID=UPI0024BA3C36|nr:hypothetical protein [Rothia sp. SD9660Na]WHS51368.1 hypothetical protein QM007_05255 [Rothia sp. SD9660Na]
MQTRTRGKLVAHLAGASLVATSTLGAAAVAVETYGDLQSTETATANSPVTEQTSPSATETSTGTSSSTTGSTSHTTSSGS